MREDEIMIDGEVLPKYWKYIGYRTIPYNVWKTKKFEIRKGVRYLKVEYIGQRDKIFSTILESSSKGIDYIDLMNLTNSYYSHYKPMKFNEFI